MGVLNNHRLNELTDEELEEDLDRDLLPDLKGVVLSQLLKRRIQDTIKVIKGLDQSIKNFNKASAHQTERMIRLTKWIIALTIAMLVGLLIQIIIVAL